MQKILYILYSPPCQVDLVTYQHCGKSNSGASLLIILAEYIIIFIQTKNSIQGEKNIISSPPYQIQIKFPLALYNSYILEGEEGMGDLVY